jgi:hypothetical protein
MLVFEIWILSMATEFGFRFSVWPRISQTYQLFNMLAIIVTSQHFTTHPEGLSASAG